LKILDFQDLRKKNKDNLISEKEQKNIKYIFVAFDILLYNDKQLYFLNLEDRKKILIENFFGKIPEIVIEAGKEINFIEPELFKAEIFEYYEVAKRINCEGLIIKFLGSNTFYEFGKRKWLKVNYILFKIL
jgi:ATP-dependent DNA ligase